MGPDGKVQIETRGEGGLFLCAPSEGYDLMQGSWETLPVFTPQERKSLWEAARTDSSDLASASAPIMEPPALRPAAQPLFDPYEGLSPAEDFNLRGDVRALLLRHGWTLCTSKSENEEWTRPGKTSGVSATLRKMDGIEIFYVFSSNALPFEAQQGYNPFQVYTLLEHDGNASRAAETLLKEGEFGQKEIPDYDYLLTAKPSEVSKLDSDSPSETSEMEPEEDLSEESGETPSAGLLPEEIYRIPGFMGLMFQDVLATAPRRQPEFALAAALCAQSLLCHQKYCSPQGFRANIYCLISGKSGCGKDWGRYYLKELFTNLQMTDSIRESYQSFPAIQNDLRYYYSPKLILWDEFGKAIQMMGLHTAAPHTKEIIPGLMKLYTSAHTWFTPSIKADIGDRKTRPDYSPIPNPFVTLLGTATPEQLLGNLSMEMVSEGFLGRAFLFEAEETPGFIPTIRPQVLRIADVVLSEALRQQAAPLTEWDPDQKGTDASKPPEARTVGMVPAAEKLLNELLIRQTEHIEQEENGVLWARAEEQAEKLALLYAVSEDPETPILTEAAARWGIQLAEHLTLKRIYLAQTWVSDSDFDAKQKEVLRYVRAQGGEVARDKLRQRFWKWNAKERNEIFDNLTETGKLKFRKEKVGKTEKKIYYTRKRPSTDPQ